MNDRPRTGEIWEHYRTKGAYEILGIGKMQVKVESLDMKECVLYKALADGSLWSRPLEDFIEVIAIDGGESVPRFQKVR